jgi:hypothetical protein
VIYVNPAWEQLTYQFAHDEGGWNQIEISSGKGAAQIGGRLADPNVLRRWFVFSTLTQTWNSLRGRRLPAAQGPTNFLGSGHIIEEQLAAAAF